MSTSIGKRQRKYVGLICFLVQSLEDIALPTSRSGSGRVFRGLLTLYCGSVSVTRLLIWSCFIFVSVNIKKDEDKG